MRRHVALNEKCTDDAMKFLKELQHYEWPELVGRIETLSEFANSACYNDSFEDTSLKDLNERQKVENSGKNEESPKKP